jgi:hypothetical protein
MGKAAFSAIRKLSAAVVLILALARAKNRLKPELQAGEGWIGGGSEFRLQAVGRQNETTPACLARIAPMNLEMHKALLIKPTILRFMGRTAGAGLLSIAADNGDGYTRWHIQRPAPRAAD